MSYRFLPSLVLRTPLYGFKERGNMDYAALLHTEVFRKAIFLSSELLFEALHKKGFAYDTLSEKERHTVQKYANRASFRSTPFGMFAAVSLTSWQPASTASIVVTRNPSLYVKPDFSILPGIAASLGYTNQAMELRINQSAFTGRNDIRFIRREFSELDARFALVAAPRNSLLRTLMRLAKRGISRLALAAAIRSETGASAEEVSDYIKELEAEQLLVSASAPNITGNDYTQELLPLLEQQQPVLKKILRELTENRHPSLAFLSATAAKLSAYTGQKPKSSFYCVAERKAIAGGLPMKYQQQIKEGLHCLQLLSSYTPSPDLEQFRKAFLAQYEREEVPLLEALDPQLGIGYGSFGEMGNQVLISSLGLDIAAARTAKKNQPKNLAALLMNEWMQQRKLTGLGEVAITNDHLKEISSENNSHPLPPSIAVMFRVVDGQVIIESAGGASALQMTGRFSCISSIEAFAQEVARHEQEMNPGVVFAEIAHFCNVHAANINRRQHLRRYEIPVLTNSTLPGNRQIPLADLMISVVDNTVVLRSRKLGKPVIPRLASAYNYTKNSLPIFRFLCDVQSQQLTTSFSLSLSSAVPGLKFYPRVRYRSCIIHLAEWHLYEEELAPLANADPSNRIRLFRQLCAEIHLPRYVALTIHDNFIVYDLNLDAEVSALLIEIKPMRKVALKEFIYPQESLIKTEGGTELIGQYIATLILDEPSYKEIPLTENRKQPVTPKDTGNWLYFKVYCHPLSADGILLQHLLPIVEKSIRTGIVQQWFWLRYNDPEHHLRIRLKTERRNQGKVFELFNHCLHKLYLSKLVHRFQTDVYKRELERYSAALIVYVEALFHCSSNIVVRYLQKAAGEGYREEEVVVEGVSFANRLLGYFGFSTEKETDFCKKNFEAFYQEHGGVKGFRTEAEKLYRTMQPALEEALVLNETMRDFDRVGQNVHFLLVKLSFSPPGGPDINSLAADIVHMHINRLFSSNQRYYEMLVYFMLYRHLTVRAFRQRPS